MLEAPAGAKNRENNLYGLEALESGMCDFIKIRLKGVMQREVEKKTSR